jgi:uncharacterized membrane protein YeaQ/YmgE (transglycosylase-associated protein family)
MGFFEIITLLIIAGITGSIGRSLSGFTKRGCLISILVGFIGALIGTWLSRELNLPELFILHLGNTKFPVIWSIIGAALFTALLSMLSSRSKN